MHTISGPAVDGDAAVDELADAISALVRTWRGAARRLPESGHSIFALMQLTGLLDDGEHRLGEIAERRGVDQSVVSRQIGDLQARGLVCRRPDPSDGRATLVRLTPDGRELATRARALERDLVRGALSRRPGTDVRTAARVVAALADELDARLDDPDTLRKYS
jgi:DNA-binding MarR family transcriptional regulator